MNCALPSGRTDADYGLLFNLLFMPVAREYSPILRLAVMSDRMWSPPEGESSC